MKKYIVILFINLCILTLTACNGNVTTSDNTEINSTESIETEAIIPEVQVLHIDFHEYEVQFVETEENAVPYMLSLVLEQENNVSEVLDWFGKNNLSLPMLGSEWDAYIELNEQIGIDFADEIVFYDENYIYQWTENHLNIYDIQTELQIYQINYELDRWYLMGNCAYLENDILYLGSISRNYASPNSSFLIAYDLKNEQLIWRSEDQTFNSMNFIVKDDVIFCGYGFTDEADYLYQIDKNTGKVISKTKLKKMPDLLAEKDGELYVHTYSYDYRFDMTQE